ncbi:ATP-binding protein [Rugosimonospora acidiphila]|uniref:Nuclease SbcCD subunit C n=1 Tax=Rugosimonospora acidiphila TaxID=556531 RepID=A0ABP9SRU9_9ACTN
MTREPLIELLFDRLAKDGVPAATAEVVLAAVSGDDDLVAALAGQPTTLAVVDGGEDTPREHIYLSAVTVAGFRGIGPERTLPIPPEPGLTVVVGRNGSGKSSFAEAVELSLTGDSARWADRHSVWRTGWRNLHAPQDCAITTELHVDGTAGPTRVRRSWPVGAELADAEVTVTGPRGRRTSLADLGLARALQLYRPFLTAADLGKLLSGTPSDLFDAIDAILGLDALTAADKRLLAAARPLEAAATEVRTGRATLSTRLTAVQDDDRARRAAQALSARTPDLDLLDSILDEPVDAGPGEAIATCRRLHEFTVPDPGEMSRLADDLRATATAGRQHDGVALRASVRVAELLRLALDHHDDVGDGSCPVCGTGSLNAAWHATASTTLDQLRTGTLAARRAVDQLTSATRQVRGAIAAVTVPGIDPVAAVQLPDLGLKALSTAVARLHAAPANSAEALADHLTTTYPEVTAAAAAIRARAASWLENRDSAWRQIADDLRLWVAATRATREQESTAALLKDARGWLKGAGAELRDERLTPFAEHSQRIWRQLRQESNVELGRMSLIAANTRRRIALPVSVDGVDNGTALGVMSQGELHALGLAAFLPRSCADESPFRFVVIDDPVQSMDPAKVDGLARVLGDLAIDRQIVVFTHDNRLPEAIRNLELKAEIIEVLRAEGSVVTLRTALDPVIRYLDDATAVAYSGNVPADLRAPVVAELCRSALEAACHRVVWRHRLSTGHRHVDIEAAITATGKSVTQAFALALFDDAARGSDVLPRLNRRYGPWAADAYQACRKGVHGLYLNDLRQLVADCRRLVRALA